jgi:hypothetical protein
MMHSIILKKRFIPTLSLLVLLVASCAPEASSTQQPAAPVAGEPSPTAFAPSDSVPASTDVAAPPTEAAAPLPVATSRGDGLEATNPASVSLASGGLQFVEFFRFT